MAASAPGNGTCLFARIKIRCLYFEGALGIGTTIGLALGVSAGTVGGVIGRASVAGLTWEELSR